MTGQGHAVFGRPGSAGLLVLALSLAAGGCGMKAYDGPARPAAETAVLERWSRHGVFPGIETGSAVIQTRPVRRYRHHVIVTEVDGRPTGLAPRIELLPGRHSVTVEYFRRPDTLTCRLGGCAPDYRSPALSVTFGAAAGHRYRIRGERADGRNWLWVEDVTENGVPPGIVTGRRPPKT